MSSKRGDGLEMVYGEVRLLRDIWKSSQGWIEVW